MAFLALASAFFFDFTLRGDFIPVVDTDFAGRLPTLRNQIQHIPLHTFGLMRWQHAKETETAEIGYLAGKQSHIRNFRH